MSDDLARKAVFGSKLRINFRKGRACWLSARQVLSGRYKKAPGHGFSSAKEIVTFTENLFRRREVRFNPMIDTLGEGNIWMRPALRKEFTAKIDSFILGGLGNAGPKVIECVKATDVAPLVRFFEGEGHPEPERAAFEALDTVAKRYDEMVRIAGDLRKLKNRALIEYGKGDEIKSVGRFPYMLAVMNATDAIGNIAARHAWARTVADKMKSKLARPGK